MIIAILLKKRKLKRRDSDFLKAAVDILFWALLDGYAACAVWETDIRPERLIGYAVTVERNFEYKA
ncbi:MAG: hypothetical protein K0S76_1390 [Herbinix sp.]|jgi:hypothetical protein|nr:hypothetical protein [Herbinix sp.]